MFSDLTQSTSRQQFSYQFATLRRRTFDILEVARGKDRISVFCDRILIFVIAVNVVAVTLETVESIRHDWALHFYLLELISVAIFTLEYILRVWSCVEAPDDITSTKDAVYHRIRYIFSPMAIIDLVAFLPFYLSLVVGIDLRILRVIRLLRVLKLSRYSPALSMLFAVFRQEAATFFAAFFCIGHAVGPQCHWHVHM